MVRKPKSPFMDISKHQGHGICFDDTIKTYSFIQNVDKPRVYNMLDGSNVSFLILCVEYILLIKKDIMALSPSKGFIILSFLLCRVCGRN